MSRKETWSLADIQNMAFPRDWGKKETIYSSDADKCLCGVYHSLIGSEQTEPDDPRGLRRMDVGNMVEMNQVKKLKSMGVFLDAQTRIFDPEYKVSGRYDGLIISPIQCTSRAKKLIERKKEIFLKLDEHQKNFYKGLAFYQNNEIKKEEFLKGREKLNLLNDALFDEESKINQELMEPNTKNSLMLLEIKSISDAGFLWRKKEGKPSEGHEKQTMFYFWKLREKYPNLVARILYVDVPYQNLLEFDLKYNEEIIEGLKRTWKYLWDCVEKKIPPIVEPSILQSGSKYKLNWKAEYCKYHSLCTGEPDWKGEALMEVKRLNSKKTISI